MTTPSEQRNCCCALRLFVHLCDTFDFCQKRHYLIRIIDKAHFHIFRNVDETRWTRLHLHEIIAFFSINFPFILKSASNATHLYTVYDTLHTGFALSMVPICQFSLPVELLALFCFLSITRGGDRMRDRFPLCLLCWCCLGTRSVSNFIIIPLKMDTAWKVCCKGKKEKKNSCAFKAILCWGWDKNGQRKRAGTAKLAYFAFYRQRKNVLNWIR